MKHQELTREDFRYIYTAIRYQGARRYSRQLGLLFVHTEGDRPTMQDMINTCVRTANMFGNETPLVVERYNSDAFVVSLMTVDTDVLAYPNAQYMLYNPQTKRITFEKENDHYFGCSLPQKQIIGCDSCRTRAFAGKTEPNDKHCQTLWLQHANHKAFGTEITEGFWSDRSDVMRKTVLKKRPDIGRYTFISSAWTTHENFQSAFRSPDEHTFDYDSVMEAKEELSRRADSGNEVKSWLRKNCPTCLVQDGCKASSNRWDRCSCSRTEQAYHYTKEEALDTILENSIIPYTDKQLRILLRYSGHGELPKRMQRCLTIPTFITNNHCSTTGDYLRNREELGFVFVRRTSPGQHMYTPKSFKDTVETLAKYMDVSVKQLIRNARSHPMPTKHDKVMLMVGAARSYTPLRQRGFGCTQYQINSVEQQPYWNGSGSRWKLNVTLNCGQSAWFEEKYENLQDVFEGYRDIPLLPTRCKGEEKD